MTKFGEELLESLGDALAHAKGEVSGVRVRTIELPDVRALRRTLAARGFEQRCVIVRACDRCVIGYQQAAGWQVRHQIDHASSVLRFKQHHSRRAVGQNLRLLRGSQAIVQAHSDEPGELACRIGLDVFRAILRKDGKPVAFAHLERDQRIGKAYCPLSMLTVGNGAPFKAQCRVLWIEPSVPLDDVSENHGPRLSAI